jgi:hypothetical protein
MSIDTSQSLILQAITLQREPGTVIELRIPHAVRNQTISGYYNDYSKLAHDAAQWSSQAEGVYITLNPVSPSLLARSANHLTPYAKHTTKDENIEGRRWLFIDFDPVRAAGISSTDEEHRAALERAAEIRDYLKELGFPEPVLADSGNGGHLLYRVDLPNKPESTDLIKRCLEALAFRFTDKRVEIDTSTYNASRIIKLYGTVAAKGDSLPDRPHRLAKLIEIPNRLEVTSLEMLKRLSAMVPEPPKEKTRTSATQLDVDGFLAQHGLETMNAGAWRGGDKWALRVCPFNPEHKRGEAYILRFTDGTVVAGCLHRSCRRASGEAWRELRGMYEPSTGNHPQDSAISEDNEGVPDNFAPLWGDLETLSLDSLDFVIHETARGEVAQLTSATNIGKTTVLLNTAISVACGKSFPPLVMYSGQPRKVLFLDFESRPQRLYQDIRRMMANLTEDERVLVRKNLAIACDVEFNNEPLSLSRQAHMSLVAQRAKALKTDLIIIDTAAGAFDINNENDNAEVSRRIQKPLKHLARIAGATVLYSHHIGKAGEQGAARESRAYRGRGASAYACFARSVFNLEPDSHDPDRVILTCAKVKGERFNDVVLHLDRLSRWFNLTDETPPKIPTNYELVVGAIDNAGKPISLKEIDAELEGRVAKATITRSLINARKRGDIVKLKQGLYVRATNAQMLAPLGDKQISISEDSSV